MAHHDESLIDKVKNAFGMGDDREEAADLQAQAGAATDTADTADAEALDGGRDDGWAGVPEALYEDTVPSDSNANAHAREEVVGSEGYPTADEPSGLGRNPGPVGSARYEDGANPSDLGGTDLDAAGGPDLTREEVGSTEFGGAYGTDDTPLPTSAAWDRGEAPPEGEAGFGTDEPLDPRRDRDI
jgi:hypothetical protein